MPYLLLQTIAVPVLAAVFILAARQRLGNKACWIARGSLLYTTALLLFGAFQVKAGRPLIEAYPFAGPAITIDLLGDGISLPTALIINMLCTGLSFYAGNYIDHRIEAIYGSVDKRTWNKHFTTFFSQYLLFPATFMGVCFASNLIGLYFFLEILPLPLYFIMAFFGYVDRVKVAMICLMWAMFGAGFFLVGTLLVYFHTGSFHIADIHLLAGQPVAFWVILLTLIAILSKMAVVPFQVWMPWVHAEHPTCIAGLLAVYANIAAYVLLRMLIIPLFDDFRPFSQPLMLIALITMIYGALLTLAQTDVKRFAACSTISQLAYSLLGLSALTLSSIEGGMFFFLSHIMGKTILFSTAGILVYVTGIRDMRQMGGIAQKMPLTALLWIIGSLALAGFPPMSSFAAEWVMFAGIFQTGLQAGPVGLAVAILGAAAITLTVAYCFRSIKIIFFGPLGAALANHDPIKDPPLSMSLPLLLIAGVSIGLGIYPDLILNLFNLVIGNLALP
ncbi:MAG: proton-conducting transporter membrane subunit [Thermodesulfobacteriota bacterium]